MWPQGLRSPFFEWMVGEIGWADLRLVMSDGIFLWQTKNGNFINFAK